MTEKEILKLGFVKEFSSDTVDNQPEYYYYTKDFTNGLTFITNASDEVTIKGWYIEFFNTEIPIRYYKHQDVRDLFDLIEKGLRHENNTRI